MDSRPNILLLMTDQQRGDCLGIDGHPVQQTPFLDETASHGIRFRKGYTACPICVAARRTLMTGQRPATQGVLSNASAPLPAPTLPGELAAAGYHTHLVGKLHLSPPRKLYGFDSSDWADAPRPHPAGSDYDRFLDEQGASMPRASVAHGMSVNGYPARPWHLDEHLHFSNWCADSALRFLDRRDPTAPFFLKVSFFHPHQPLTPPVCYYDRYMGMDLPEPFVGDWARVFDGPQRGLPVNAWRVCLEPAQQKQMRAAYYGCVEHVDSQIGRILDEVPKHNTIIVFVSDHGEMLGDHQWIRKRNAFEPSARVPYMIRFPKGMGIEQGQVRDEVVELMDLMPTLLDAAGVDVPDTVEGRSLMPLVRGESEEWREYIHGECSEVPTMNSGQQYLTDGRRKYIWYPGTGAEHYFDLENDPREMVNLADEPGCADELKSWRERLAEEIKDRPEGFVSNGALTPIGGSSPSTVPGMFED